MRSRWSQWGARTAATAAQELQQQTDTSLGKDRGSLPQSDDQFYIWAHHPEWIVEWDYDDGMTVRLPFEFEGRDYFRFAPFSATLHRLVEHLLVTPGVPS